MKHPLFKNPYQEKRLIQRRVLAAALLSVVLIFGLILRLAYLQLFKNSFYTTLSQQNHRESMVLLPTRGLIYDRNGVLLARNLPIFSLDILPSATPDMQKTIQRLSLLLPISSNQIELFYKTLHQQQRYNSIPLILKLTEEEIALFSFNRYQFPGVEIKARMLRDYPKNEAFAHVIGYVGGGEEENHVGKTGLEAYYETELHGHPGSKEIEIDARGNIIRLLKINPPISGKTLTLTIDAHLQAVAMQALGKIQGALVALDPNNGEILAMVSVPSFNPNLLVQGILQIDYDKLTNDPSKPMYNRVLNATYPPGSSIKPFLGVTALGENIVTNTETIFDPGYFKLKNSTHIFHDWDHRGHGWVNMHRAIVVSCDTYFYWLSLKMGMPLLHHALHSFGFGEKTGIDLPYEAAGILPSPAWKEKKIGQPWFPGDTLNTSIGQGFALATPLQLAVATATLAERGRSYVPHLVRTPSSVSPRSVLAFSNPQAYTSIIIAMQDVIRSPEGRGFRFGRNATYSVAAKTGTAQVFSLNGADSSKFTQENLRDHGIFIAFAPVDHPKIAVAVISEHAAHVAPLVARKVMDAYLLQKK